MDNPDFLGHFWTLSSFSLDKQKEAAIKIVETLKGLDKIDDRTGEHKTPVTPSACKSTDELLESRSESLKKGFQYKLPSTTQHQNITLTESLQYTVNRLIHGLSSDRECIRLGYADTLSLIVKSFPETITLYSIAEAIHLSFSIKHTINGDHGKDYGLACLVGYSLLHELLFFSSSTCTTLIDSILEDICIIYEKKVYFRDPAANLLGAIVVQCESHSLGLPLKGLNQRCTLWMNLLKQDKIENGDSSLEKTGSSPLRNQKSALSCMKKDPLMFLEPLLSILSHSSVIYCLHPRIPAAWVELVRFLVNRTKDGMPPFQCVLEYLMKRFFSHSKQQVDSDGSTTCQRIFAGLRILLECLAALKQEYVLRPAVSIAFIKTFWTSACPLMHTLVYHIQPCRRSQSLYLAAMSTLILLREIVQGLNEKQLKPDTSELGSVNVRNVGIYRVDFETDCTTEIYETAISSCLPNECTLAPEILVEYLRKTNTLGALDSGALTRLVHLTLDTQSDETRETFVAHWLSSGCSSSLEEWLWRFDFAVQAVCCSTTLGSRQRHCLASQLIVSVFLVCCFKLKPLKNTKLPALVTLHLRSSRSLYVIPYISKEMRSTSADALLHKHLVTRLSPLLGRIWGDYRTLLVNLKKAAHTPQNAVEEDVDYTMDSFLYFQNDFLKSLLDDLNGLFTMKAKDQEEQLSVSFLRPRVATSYTKTPKDESITCSVRLSFTHSDVLPSKTAQMCIQYGLCVSRMMKFLMKSIEGSTTDGVVVQRVWNTLITLHSFGCLTFKPFLLCCVSINDELEGENSLRCSMGSTVRVLTEVYGCMEDTLQCMEMKEEKLEPNVVGTLLQVLVDAIPDLLLDLPHHSGGSVSDGFSVAQGLVSSSFLPIWRYLATYVSDGCIENLINGLLTSTCSGDDSSGEDATDTDDPSCDDSAKETSASEDFSDTEMASDTHDAHESIESSHDQPCHEDEVIEDERVASFLLEEGVPGGVGIEEDKETTKRRRFQKHLDRLHYQRRFRRVDIVQQALQNVLKDTHLPPHPFPWLLKHFMWSIQLLRELRREVNTILRYHKKHGSLTTSKKLETELRKKFCRRLEQLVSSYSAAFLRFCFQSPLPNLCDSIENFCQYRVLLKNAFALLDDILMKPLFNQGCLRSQESTQAEELGALLMLVGGVLEELLWNNSCDALGSEEIFTCVNTSSRDEHFKVPWKALDTSTPLNTTLDTNVPRSCCSLNDTSGTRTVASCGLFVTDYVVKALCVWVNTSHPPIGERFFRSLTTYSRRYFSSTPLIGLMALPFGTLATHTPKLFVFRECVCVFSELLSLSYNALKIKRGHPTHQRLPFLMVEQLRLWRLAHFPSTLQDAYAAHDINTVACPKGFHGLFLMNVFDILMITSTLLHNLGDASTLYSVKYTTATHQQKSTFTQQIRVTAKRCCSIARELPFEVPSSTLNGLHRLVSSITLHTKNDLSVSRTKRFRS